MSLRKTTQALLKVLTQAVPNVATDYETIRRLKKIRSKPLLTFGYRMWDEQIISQGHKIPVRIFTPYSSRHRDSALLFFHGGGWVTGDIDSYSAMCGHMARMTERVVFSVDYRLAPEHPYPDGLNDCYEAARLLFNRCASLGLAQCNIALIGDSAGGNLAAAVSLMARDRGEFFPRKQILLYPATWNDHSNSSPFDSVRDFGDNYMLTSQAVTDYMRLYQRSEDNRQEPYFAPLVSKDLSRQPDTLVLTAQYDPLRDEGEAYAKKLAEFGNKAQCFRIAKGLHGYFTNPLAMDLIQQSYRYISDFLNEVTE